MEPRHEVVASDERDTIEATGGPRRRTFFIAAIPGSLV
jgi:translocation and assembly module TamA